MLEKYWYIVCRSNELASKPLPFTLFNKPIVLFRDNQGLPAALEDRCLHRNAPLSCGKVLDNTLQCPYHGWRYAANGELVEIPYSATCQKTAIPSYFCCEQDGYVWVSVGHPQPGVTPFRFPHLDETGWLSFRMDTLFSGSVEACLENFLDCPHALHVHRLWFRTPTSRPVKAVIRSLPDGAIVEYFEEPREKSLVWLLLSPAQENMQHTDRFIAPATSCVTYRFDKGREYSITSSCTPIDDKTTWVHTVISFQYGKLAPFIRLFFAPLARIIIKQDVQIMQQQQQNIERFGESCFTVIPEDVLFRPIAAWRKALREGGPLPPAGDKSYVDLHL